MSGDFGIDVSAYNAITDWAAVRQGGTSWAWSKLTQGSYYANPLRQAQVQGARAAGLTTGGYHFGDPDASIADNTSGFVSIGQGLGVFAPGSMLPMLDIENSPSDGIVWTAAAANSFIPSWRDRVRQLTGIRKICVYSSQSWWATGFLTPDAWADADTYLCAARYGVAPGWVGWSHKRLAAHQYTDAATSAGITGGVDRSVIVNGFSLADLTLDVTKGNGMTEFIKDMNTPGRYARVDGGLVTGVDEATAHATMAAWPGTCTEMGLTKAQFDDMVAKSNALTGILPAVQALTVAVGNAPVGPGGPTLEAIQALMESVMDRTVATTAIGPSTETTTYKVNPPTA